MIDNYLISPCLLTIYNLFFISQIYIYIIYIHIVYSELSSPQLLLLMLCIVTQLVVSLN